MTLGGQQERREIETGIETGIETEIETETGIMAVVMREIGGGETVTTMAAVSAGEVVREAQGAQDAATEVRFRCTIWPAVADLRFR